MSERQAPDSAKAWARVRHALTGRPTRGQWVVAALFLVLGFAAVTQVRSANDDGYAGMRRDELVNLLETLDSTEDRLTQQRADLSATQRRLQQSSERNQAAIEETRKAADTLAILAGTVPTVGPGVVITIEDPDSTVGASTLLNAIEELRDAGAESIQVNGVVRVVAQSYVTDSPEGGVRIDGREVKRPFVIEAIGDSHTLDQAVVFRGGLVDQVEALGGDVAVEQTKSLEITALAEEREAEYARPAR
ncbi:DUF881 domain-containing protein [Mumia sp. zg.B53]|uniref:DUF881 domain-containing protein n=1 Tax=unclassified Mumia TaxID=2621872 RepID=UPI001C6E28FE|nr:MULTISPECIES: DUF881 domain-containing protein [unclassified Mumia]MBW9205003.1 DUF881 domain-containing protein [Mumia sp. zg.B17]MBW9208992.1 DUF881 domain-containing protein [Mumia sp. zg.B21]MBW9213603.1 DUF881 domain-containing protein [Mumia sp. zg.B53]MDD9347493.1 DUF881 domain-containing protein [Mumia sp.]